MKRLAPPFALGVELLAGCLAVIYSGTPLAYALVVVAVLTATIALVGSVVLFRRQKIVSALCILVGVWFLAQLFIPLGAR